MDLFRLEVKDRLSLKASSRSSSESSSTPCPSRLDECVALLRLTDPTTSRSAQFVLAERGINAGLPDLGDDVCVGGKLDKSEACRLDLLLEEDSLLLLLARELVDATGSNLPVILTDMLTKLLGLVVGLGGLTEVEA